MQFEMDLGFKTGDLNMLNRVRGFEIVEGFDSEGVKLPVRATKLSAGYDIFNNTGREIVLQPGEISEKIPTKLKSYMLGDEYLGILPRSGHGFKYSVRLCNTEGIIDADYYDNPKTKGHILIKLHNQGNDTLTIAKGEAFAQGIFKKYLLIDGDSLDNGNERAGGFGSTTGTV